MRSDNEVLTLSKRPVSPKPNNASVKVIMRENKQHTKRGNTERRGWRPMPKIPFVDSSGVLVTKDRRKTLDRRVSDLAEEINIKTRSK